MNLPFQFSECRINIQLFDVNMGKLGGLNFVHVQVMDELRKELRQPLSQEPDKPLAYNLKKNPEMFYKVLAHMENSR